jgi:rod shape-determining protein MreC
MRNLLNFLSRYNNLIIFLILEGIAFSFLISGNHYQNSKFVHRVHGLTRGISERMNNTKNFVNLGEINASLAAENVELKNKLERLNNKEEMVFLLVSDSVLSQNYEYTSAEVIENSVNRQKNFFTINKGSRQGIKVDMAVTVDDGAAGVIVGCSENYSVAMSVLNLDFRLSARIRSNGYFGSLNWDGGDFSHAILSEIPHHVGVNVGDTIETTGYSAIFPEGVLIGTISDFEKTGGDFYKIRVALATDFKKLHFVNVIGNLRKEEQQNLEKQFQ